MEQLTTWATTFGRNGTCLAHQREIFANAREHAGVSISLDDEHLEVQEEGLDTSESFFGA
ncbi:hypothetical protein PHLGIDRAFT_29670 [Phlebiopsis gigantea 11061_1 CR5-6]|uniref:Uncharacterized protein n=1 Tax=Phlebiopsis gigantea (strain 11061_1 CR5-6) TaxID=745531 RepID=A0A0C3SBS7_PHLG1|nr:hypothetical protein PHLGIDRAFT_29670 [Phlebiopsis gigantea 11061_1 CR5-6]